MRLALLPTNLYRLFEFWCCLCRWWSMTSLENLVSHGVQELITCWGTVVTTWGVKRRNMHYVKFIRSLTVLCYGKLKAFTFGRLLTLTRLWWEMLLFLGTSRRGSAVFFCLQGIFYGIEGCYLQNPVPDSINLHCVVAGWNFLRKYS